MKKDRPLILISNDDGYQARGIEFLSGVAAEFGDVIVCAPDSARSGQSRAFSMTPLTMHAVSAAAGISVHRCSGTPVDCVKMAFEELCPRKPDLVLGGINHGDNSSVSAQYSGTVGIVMEGAMKGVPSVAFSLCDYRPEADFTPMRPLIRSVVEDTLASGLPPFTCLNVNYPLTGSCLGTRVCRMARGHWCKEVVRRRHPSGMGDYYWMSGFYQNDEPEAEDTDAWALSHGYAAITPLTVDLTDYPLLRKMTGK